MAEQSDPRDGALRAGQLAVSPVLSDTVADVESAGVDVQGDAVTVGDEDGLVDRVAGEDVGDWRGVRRHRSLDWIAPVIAGVA